MRTEKYSTNDLHNYLIKNKIASISDLKKVLGTKTHKTVFRKLKKLAYRSSYSHKGMYYTTNDIAEFDKLGLWSYKSVWFSIYGTLSETIKRLTENSEAGYSVRELDDLLHVSTKETLLNIYKKKFGFREKISGVYHYFSIKPSIRKHQVLMRKSILKSISSTIIVKELDELSDKVKAAIILFFSILNEKQRRLYVGLEALKLGYGGDKIISELLGVDVHTIAKGRKELLSGDVDIERIRKASGGSKKIKKNSRDN